MPLRIKTVEGRRTVVCEPKPPVFGVLPAQRWRPTKHASLLQQVLLRPDGDEAAAASRGERPRALEREHSHAQAEVRSGRAPRRWKPRWPRAGLA
jgi:hypothetical protein